MLVFLVDRAQSTVNRKGVPEAGDIGKHILEYRYIIFGPAENERAGSKTRVHYTFNFCSIIDTRVIMM